MKTFLTFIFLLLSTLSFSQKFKNDNGFVTYETDTIAKIKDYDKNLKVSIVMKSNVPFDVIFTKSIDKEKKQQLHKDLFYGCNVNYIDTISDTISSLSKIQSILMVENIDYRQNLNLSSQYLIKSAKQRNQALIVGIAGSVISGILYSTIIKNGYNPVNNVTFVMVGAATTVGVITLSISSNNNQKKAGLALRLK